MQHGSTALFALPSLQTIYMSDQLQLLVFSFPFPTSWHSGTYTIHIFDTHVTHNSCHPTPPLSWPTIWATERGPVSAPECCCCVISSQVQDYQLLTINKICFLTGSSVDLGSEDK